MRNPARSLVIGLATTLATALAPVVGAAVVEPASLGTLLTR